jgi:hypothetical protein
MRLMKQQQERGWMPSGRIEKKTARLWNTPGLACLGAFLGIALATAHHILHVSAGDLSENDVVVHIFGELFVATGGGALLLGIISELRNRLVRRGDGRANRSRVDVEP